MKYIYASAIIIILLSSCSLFDSGDPREPEWVIGVYAAADNDLEEEILYDIYEMGQATLGSSKGQYIKVFVLVDRYTGDAAGDFEEGWTDTRLYEIEYSSNSSERIELASTELKLTLTDEEELAMNNPATLSAFADFIKTKAGDLNTAIIIESHADGWYPSSSTGSTRQSVLDISYSIAADGISDLGNSYEYMGTDEMADALNGKGIDIVATDACNMGNLETIYEMRDACTWFTGAPYTIRGAGQNYETLFNLIQSERNSVSGVAKAFATAYNTEYSLNDYEQVMAFNTEAITTLIESTGTGSFDEWVTALISADMSSVQTDRNDSKEYNDTNNRDLIQFMNYQGTSNLAQSFKDAITPASGENEIISIWFPATYTTHSDKVDYETHLDLPDITQWNEFLTAYDNGI